MANNNKSKKYKERRLWTLMQEEILVELWEEKFGELRRHRKNMHIYAEIANRLGVMNSVFTPEEVQSKIHNLTNRYRNEKKSIGPLKDSPSQWHLFNKVHKILGGQKMVNEEQLVQDSIVESDEVMAQWSDLQQSWDLISNNSAASSSDSNSSTSSSSTSPAAKKRRENDFNEGIRKTLKVIQDTRQTFLQKYVENETERNDHLKELIKILKN